MAILWIDRQSQKKLWEVSGNCQEGLWDKAFRSMQNKQLSIGQGGATRGHGGSEKYYYKDFHRQYHRQWECQENCSGPWHVDPNGSRHSSQASKSLQEVGEVVAQPDGQGDEEGASQDLQGIRSDDRHGSLKISDNILAVILSAVGEERAGWPHPCSGGLLEGLGLRCEK